MMDHIAEDEAFLSKICFSDDATLHHLSGKVNRHNIRVWEVKILMPWMNTQETAGR
jgi:hypothetical protein